MTNLDQIKLIKKLASRAFLDEEEEEQFLILLNRENLIVRIGLSLEKCFNTPPENDHDGSELILTVSKLIIFQFENTHNIRRKINCTPYEARMLIDFTISLLNEFIRQHYRSTPNIIYRIRQELRTLVINRKLGDWNLINEALNFTELERFENELREDNAGEAAILVSESQEKTNLQSNNAQLKWKAKLEKLHWLGSHLQETLKWIQDAQSFVNFLDPNHQTLVAVTCVNIHQGNLALLILMLIESSKIQCINGNGKWLPVEACFFPLNNGPWTKSWAKLAYRNRQDKGKMRGFLEETEELRKYFRIENEDITNFLGNSAAETGEK